MRFLIVVLFYYYIYNYAVIFAYLFLIFNETHVYLRERWQIVIQLCNYSLIFTVYNSIYLLFHDYFWLSWFANLLSRQDGSSSGSDGSVSDNVDHLLYVYTI